MSGDEAAKKPRPVHRRGALVVMAAAGAGVWWA